MLSSSFISFAATIILLVAIGLQSNTANAQQQEQATNNIFVGTKEGSIQIWNIDSTQILNVLKGAHSDSINNIRLLSGNRRVVTTSLDRYVKVWRLRNQNKDVELVCQLYFGDKKTTYVSTIEQLANGTLVLGFFNGEIELYNPLNCQYVSRWPKLLSLNAMKALPLNENTDRQYLATSLLNEYMYTWDTETGTQEYGGNTIRTIMSLEASKTFVWSGTALNAQIYLWRNSRKENFTLYDVIETNPKEPTSILSLKLLSEDAIESRLVSLNDFGSICIWSFSLVRPDELYRMEKCFETSEDTYKLEVLSEDRLIAYAYNGEIRTILLSSNPVFQRPTTLAAKITALLYVPASTNTDDEDEEITTEASTTSSTSSTRTSTRTSSFEFQSTQEQYWTTTRNNNNNLLGGISFDTFVRYGVLISIVLLSVVILLLLILLFVNCCCRRSSRNSSN